jgi:hypothetical protein
MGLLQSPWDTSVLKCHYGLARERFFCCRKNYYKRAEIEPTTEGKDLQQSPWDTSVPK